MIRSHLCRVREQREQMGAASRRVDEAQQKIDALRGSHRATRVFAPAKFPDVENRGKQQHVFASRRFTGAAEPVALDTRVFNSNPARAGEGLDFKAPFHVMERAHKLLPQDAFISAEEGLGRLPHYLPSVSAMLLFNSTENPYRGYVSAHLLDGFEDEVFANAAGDRAKPTPAASAKKLAEAPHSVSPVRYAPSRATSCTCSGEQTSLIPRAISSGTAW